MAFEPVSLPEPISNAKIYSDKQCWDFGDPRCGVSLDRNDIDWAGSRGRSRDDHTVWFTGFPKEQPMTKLQDDVLAFSQRYSQFAFVATLLNTVLLMCVLFFK